MSQAHYDRCVWRFSGPEACGRAAVVHIRWSNGFRSVETPTCAGCLNLYLDLSDARATGSYAWTFPEPFALIWVFDAGIPQCGIHHWPAELCEGWSHRPLIERLRATYADGRPSARSDDPT